MYEKSEGVEMRLKFFFILLIFGVVLISGCVQIREPISPPLKPPSEEVKIETEKCKICLRKSVSRMTIVKESMDRVIAKENFVPQTWSSNFVSLLA